MSRNKKAYKIYGPTHFRATWDKFLEIAHRDNQSASEIIRVWVEDYVRQKDPGNPQRPISAWVPGHPDQEKLEEQEIFRMLQAFAEHRGNWIRYMDVVETLRDAGIPPDRRVKMADDLARRLSKAGVRVWR